MERGSNMKRKIVFYLPIILGLTFTTVQKASASEYVVIDIKKVLEESTAAKGIRQQIKQESEVYQQDITKKEEKIRATSKKLNEQKSLLSQDAFEEQRNKFQGEVVAVQRDVQKKRSVLDNAYGTAMQKVQDIVLSIIKEMSQQRKFNVVMAKSELVYADNTLDITNEVVGELNKRLPKVQIELKK